MLGKCKFFVKSIQFIVILLCLKECSENKIKSPADLKNRELIKIIKEE